jgi:ubiquinone/menaquinone biosynthesis C-methylase UbiE
MITTQPIIDFTAVKSRQQAAWSSGDYAVIGTTLAITGELLCEAIDVRPGQRVLDVAAGNGNATVAAARRWADVTSTDYVPALLERGRAKAEAEHLPVTFQQADAEDLPFADGSFDVVLSVFGVMFTPNQEQAAAEMVRVCRPGGKIGLVNWTPESFIGHVFRTIGKYIPPAPGVKPPALWGTEQRVRELFADGISQMTATKRFFVFRYRSAEHFLDVFRTYYGPVLKAFAALDAEGQAGLARDLTELLERFNTGGSDTLTVPSEYLEVVATRRAGVKSGIEFNHNATVVRAADVSRKITTNHNATLVRAADVNRKIEINHNATVVRATSVNHKITTNHNATLVRAGQAK